MDHLECNMNLKSTIRHSLSPSAIRTLVHAFICSRINFSNSLLYGTSTYLLDRLQSVLNSSARLILKLGKYDPISAAIQRDLHWLPIQARIRFKMNVITRNCLVGQAPEYLAELCRPINEVPARRKPTIGGTSSALGPSFSYGAYRSTWFLHLIPTTVEFTSSRHSNSIRGATSVQKETENSSHAAVHFSPLRIYVTSATSTTTTTTRKQECYRARGAAKTVIFMAKDAQRKKFCEDLEEDDGKGNVFRLAKQLVSRNRDVVIASCVKDDDGKIVVEDDKLMEVWRAHYDKISNEEFAWDRNDLTNVSPVCGSSERISALEVGVAIFKMKQGKSAGPMGVVAEMLKAAGETYTLWMTEVCNAVVKDGKVPEDWSRSWMVNVYKGKSDALTCGSYRGIKLLEHAMKVLERVIEGRLRKIVKIDNMQFGFMSGRSTTDAIFIVRQLQEKYLAKSKDLWMAFVDLEKAFDRVPREVVWWALRYLSVDEWIVSVIKAMYEDASTKVRMNGRESKAFNVKVGVHQGSVLSPLLFIIVLEALSREFREGLPMELLYADDLVLIAETKELLLEKVRKWKEGMEKRGSKSECWKDKNHVV